MIFYSNRNFKIWAYTVSHKSLLLRSYLQFHDEEGYSEDTSYNIDLEFLSVEYIDLQTGLSSMSISIIEKEDLHFDLKKKFNLFKGKIFEILSDNGRYYIIADSLLIGTNKWVQEDRIFNYDLNLDHDKIILCIPH
jgi:hypothetical protein